MHDLNEFYRLSAALTYQLGATDIAQRLVLSTILDGRAIPARDEKTILEVIGYLQEALKSKHRRLGSMAVLHPLRSAAQLVRAEDEVILLDLLTSLLHDKMEDITESRYKAGEWPALEARYLEIMEGIDSLAHLRDRLVALTRNDDETYYQYVGRLLDRAVNTPELVRIKLADRLDNTLDLRIDYRDTLDEVDFFRELFHMLGSRHFQPFPATLPHPPRPPLDGAMRMYQLFKNAVLLSLIRQKAPTIRDDATQNLFGSIATASKREAQRIVMHILAHHPAEIGDPRGLVLDTLDYCHSGGVDSITSREAPHTLDGMFAEWFDSPSREVRKQKLEKLYTEKGLMVRGSIAFIAIFLNFLSDPDYYIRGVSADGIQPDKR